MRARTPGGVPALAVTALLAGLAGSMLVARSPGTGSVLIRWLDFGLLAAVVGSLGVIALVERPARFRGSVNAAIASLHAEFRLLGLATACAAAALVAGFLRLAPHALEPGKMGSLLGGTRWGALWLAHEGLLALLLALVVRMRSARAAGAGCFAPASGSVTILAALVLAAAAMVVR